MYGFVRLKPVLCLTHSYQLRSPRLKIKIYVLPVCFTGNFARLLVDKGWTAQAESDRNTVEINLKDNNVYFGAIVKSLSNGQSKLY